MTRQRAARKRPAMVPVAASAPQPAPAMRLRWSTACGLAAACFAVYLTNLRPMGAWDSIPARLLPFSIVREGNLDLDEFHWLRDRNSNPYFLREASGQHWLSKYPVGVPLMVTPIFAPAVWWLQHRHIDEDDVRFRLTSVVMERVAAALIAATSVGVMFLAASAIAAPTMAAASALVYGLGTSTWSIGSQALWQHGLVELTLAALCLCLLLPASRRTAVAAGMCAALAVLTRPTTVVFAVLALIFIARERRRDLAAFIAVPIVGAICLLLYNHRFGSVLKGGYANATLTTPTLVALAGLLISPSRGLFIYTPVALLALLGMFHRVRKDPRWLAYLPFGIAAYLLLYGAWAGWWGGHAYGPRFLTEALPAITLCAVPPAVRLWSRPAGRAVLVTLIAWGVVVQVVGVYCDDNAWNQTPGRISERAWDWTDPQILRAARAGWHGAELAPLLWQVVADPHPARLVALNRTELAGTIALEEDTPLHFRRDSMPALRLRVTNRSEVTWPAFSDYGYLHCKLAYRWWANGSLLTESGGIPLPRNLAPGESAEVRAHVAVPAVPGTPELEVLLIQVLDRDRGTFGGTALRVPVHIE